MEQVIQLTAAYVMTYSDARALYKQLTAIQQLCILFKNIYSHAMLCNSVIPGQNPNSKQPAGGRFSKQYRLVGRVFRLSALVSLFVEPHFHQESLRQGTKPRPRALERHKQLSCFLERLGAAFIVCCLETKEQGRAMVDGAVKEWKKVKANE